MQVKTINILRKSILYSKILGKYITSILFNKNNLLLDINEKNILNILFILKNSSFFKFDILINMFCVDIKHINKLFIYYNLLSSKKKDRLFLRIEVSNSIMVQSISSLYKSANWLEREIWDFFGIFFFLHKDLRRILTDYGFEGNPLKKNFPLIGFFEISYDNNLKSVIYTYLETTQELRFYKFKSPWDKSKF